jgi:hypothetical protein
MQKGRKYTRSTLTVGAVTKEDKTRVKLANCRGVFKFKRRVNMSDMIKIPKKEYVALRMAQIMISRLDAGGVDNWEWYGESLNPDGYPDLDAMQVEIEKEIENLDELSLN